MTNDLVKRAGMLVLGVATLAGVLTFLDKKGVELPNTPGTRSGVIRTFSTPSTPADSPYHEQKSVTDTTAYDSTSQNTVNYRVK